jgi:hypothetical protein
MTRSRLVWVTVVVFLLLAVGFLLFVGGGRWHWADTRLWR